MDLCSVKLVTYFYHFDKSVADILERLHDFTAENFKFLIDSIDKIEQRNRSEISQLMVKKEELYKS